MCESMVYLCLVVENVVLLCLFYYCLSILELKYCWVEDVFWLDDFLVK